MKNNYILGINQGHNATAALLHNGKIIACVSEERFRRIKNYSGTPTKAIDFCLRFAKIKPGDLDLVVISSISPPPLLAAGVKSKKSSLVYSFTKNIYGFLTEDVEMLIPQLSYLNDFLYKLGGYLFLKNTKEKRVAEIKRITGVSKDKIIFLDHHSTHAYSAVYGSPFVKQKIKRILVFTNDAEGDGLSATVSIYENGRIRKIAETKIRNSVGYFYYAITQYLGLKPGEHEYKVMGLAPYAHDKDRDRIFDIMKDWLLVDKKNLSFKAKVHSHNFIKLCQKYLAEKRFDSIAAASQKLVEDRMVEWIFASIKKTGVKIIVAGGGVFKNVKLNKMITELPKVDKYFVFPSPGDESNAIGACYYGFLEMFPKKLPEPVKDLYLGPSYTEGDILKAINIYKRKVGGFTFKKVGNIEQKVARLLSNGEIVARFEGRSEWGDRALGNRSILADPKNRKSVEIINKMIKARDFWMPFAPVISSDYSDVYIYDNKKTNGDYMMIAYDSKEKERDNFIAAMHAYDKTTRPQILKKENNPKYHKILEHFKKITGHGVLLNTSFNIHGEPIVCSPYDAVDTFMRSGLKYLAMEDFILSKKRL